MAAWEEFQNFAFHCEKTNGRLGTTVKFAFRWKITNGHLGTRITSGLSTTRAGII